MVLGRIVVDVEDMLDSTKPLKDGAILKDLRRDVVVVIVFGNIWIEESENYEN